MRIVVSGTHASGKSTLIADFVAARPGYEVLPDPFEELEESALDLDAGTFYSQLVAAAGRLRGLRPGDRVIAERGPLDFLAYLRANNISGTYWAAGNNWTPSPTVCHPQPFPGTDRLQMAVLELYNN